MTDRSPLHLFQAYGVELEYMLVDSETLAVLPVADRLLQFESEVVQGEISWSNELVLHVIELKSTDPTPNLAPLEAPFQQNVSRINELLAPIGGRLMPTAMHPWMNPAEEMRLWPHEYHRVYETYDRIFDCRRHGWANLQSVHLNLPFAGDTEFCRLHSAIRLVLPILPALAAASPIMDGHVTGLLDTRLDVYRSNAQHIPSITASVIPEPVLNREQYEREILRPMYDDIRPLDPEGILQHEFLNSRGAIARFDRGSIEIRLLDVQECPAADLAICAAVSETIRALARQVWRSTENQQELTTATLADILQVTTRHADRARIENAEYLAQFGIRERSCSAGDIWRHLRDVLPLTPPEQPAWAGTLETILEQGPLARRILSCLGEAPSLADIRRVYGELCDCLAGGRMFRGC